MARILVIGSGGREHAIAWKLKQSPNTEALFAVPGNPGIARLAECRDLPLTGADAFKALLDFVESARIDLVVVGPEAPLAAGLVDLFQKRFAGQRKIFGPSQAAARLEASKAFCKQFMVECGIPTARAVTCSNQAEVLQAQAKFGLPIVLKADGLAAGKGVWVCAEQAQFQDALKAFFIDKAYGAAGAQIVVEECLSGEEVSFMAVCDGTSAVPLASSQDHKRLGDHDQGPNTGGMGAFCPSPLINDELTGRIMKTVIQPAVDGMKKKGTPYVGILYAGLMLTASGLRVLEFNCRLGDPETQAIMMCFDGDLVDLCEAAVDGKLQGRSLNWSQGFSVCVVMASGGYPGKPDSGHVISGLEEICESEDLQVFHAGTGLVQNRIVNTGGRVLGVTAVAATLKQAVEKAYRCVDQIHWKNEHHRRDIAAKAVRAMQERKN